MFRLCSRLLIIALAAALATGCTKKDVSKTIKAVPEDVDVVAHLDSKSLVTYTRQLMGKIPSDKTKGEVFTFDMLNNKLKEFIGIDIEKLGNLTLVGYSGPGNKMAVIAEGIDPGSLKGEKKAEHNGVPLYRMEKDINYAELKGLGVVAGSSEEILKKILDTNAGKAKNITKGNRSDMLAKLTDSNKSLDHVRMYVLNPDLTGPAAKNFTLDGAGFFIHLDKGLTLTLFSDEKGAAKLKDQIDQGLAATRMMLSSGVGMNIPIKLDDETKKVAMDVIQNIKVNQSGSIISVDFHQSLKPLIQKVLSLVFQQMSPKQPPEEPVVKEEAPTDQDKQ